ncbi:MAG: hypothetical protein LBD50_02555 [Rickettsiales bacterium]|jgi:hypothetical protein|nr:hypothetical protein [Rickettsiales bacterium]
MPKLRRAVFCYYILRFDRGMHSWLALIKDSTRVDGLLTIGDSNRAQVAKWLADLFSKKLDFDLVLHILTGDNFFEQNKRDVASLEKETGKRVIDLWDTDPIFAKYPNLRTLGRNKEFEELWAKMKQKVK